MSAALPAGVRVFERGWLSSNNILITGAAGTGLVDSGYALHAGQTAALVQSALSGRPLDRLVNTHLHSDHCGGNARLQQLYPDVQTLVPPGLAQAVRDWDPEALTYDPTGQTCERFRLDAVLQPGSSVQLGDLHWQVLAAPGHDPHSVVLFEPGASVLISADALWENGFGIVFPELEGESAFDEVAGTLDVIEALKPQVIIPGHGRVFGGADAVRTALARARSRLDSFVANPLRHASHAAKVLIKFRLLEIQRQPLDECMQWAAHMPYLSATHARYFASVPRDEWSRALIDDLLASGALALTDGWITNG